MLIIYGTYLWLSVKVLHLTDYKQSDIMLPYVFENVVGDAHKLHCFYFQSCLFEGLTFCACEVRLSIIQVSAGELPLR